MRFPEWVRPILASPRGVLFHHIEDLIEILKYKKVITVGDVSTKSLLLAGIEPVVAVVDGKTQRKKRVELGVLRRFLVVENPPGYICVESVKTLKLAIEEGLWVLVRGEEDLLAIPSLLLSPDGWALVYGQPGAGVVYLEVNEQTKKHFIEILSLSEGIGKGAILKLLNLDSCLY